MALMIDGPLFGSNVKGSIQGLGTFRSVGSKTSLTHRQLGAFGNDNAPAALKQCFADAKAAHSALPVTWLFRGGRWVKGIDPLWPEYWVQWLIDNPGCKL